MAEWSSLGVIHIGSTVLALQCGGMVNDLFSHMHLCHGKKLKCHMHKNKIGPTFLSRVDNTNSSSVSEHLTIENKHFTFYLW